MSNTSNGGKPSVGNLSYSPPQGPTSIGNSGPGLGGDNYGNDQDKVCRDTPHGSPGLGGTNHGNAGSQGKH